MDYEKKYQDLLERARKLRGENCDGCKMCLESLFDELQESEDEKIKKMIINTLNRDKILTEDEAYDCVVWLEGKGATNMKIDFLKSLKQRMEG